MLGWPRFPSSVTTAGASLVSKGSLCLSVHCGWQGWGTSPALGDLAGSWAGGPGALPGQTLGWGRIQALSPLCCAPPPGPAEAHPLPGLCPQLHGAAAVVAGRGSQGPWSPGPARQPGLTQGKQWGWGLNLGPGESSAQGRDLPCQLPAAHSVLSAVEGEPTG